MTPWGAAVVDSPGFQILKASSYMGYQVVPSTYLPLLSAERKMLCAPAETLRYVL